MGRTEENKSMIDRMASLDNIIKKLHAEADLTAKVFTGSLSEADVSIKNAIQKLDNINTQYSEYLASLSQKIECATTIIPTSIRESLIPVIEEIKKELIASQAKQFEELRLPFVEYIASIRVEAKDIVSSLNLILKKHQQEMVEVTNVMSKSKFKNFLAIVVVCICCSSLASWLINMYFPRLVEITQPGNILIKDSNVLLPDNIGSTKTSPP